MAGRYEVARCQWHQPRLLLTVPRAPQSWNREATRLSPFLSEAPHAPTPSLPGLAGCTSPGGTAPLLPPCRGLPTGSDRPAPTGPPGDSGVLTWI